MRTNRQENCGSARRAKKFTPVGVKPGLWTGAHEPFVPAKRKLRNAILCRLKQRPQSRPSLRYLLEKPGTRIGPPTFGRGFGDAEHFRSLFDRHANKVAKFDQFGVLGIEEGEAIECFVEG